MRTSWVTKVSLPNRVRSHSEGDMSTSSHTAKESADPPPKTWEGGYKKSESSGGALALMDMLVKDLTKEMTEASAEEENAQKDYETFMKDSATKRAEDSKAITDKTEAKAQ